MCICLLSLPFQPSHWHCFPDCSIIADIKSYPLQCENKGEKEKQAFSFEYTPATTSQNSDERKKKKNTYAHKSTKIPAHEYTETRRKVENAHTHTHTSQTHSTHWQTNTQKKQQTQSTAQPEVYFMQKYSKVCFTIQLNIKGWYIPLWSLTPQWTNPTHPHPLTAYRESCWTSLLITR